MPGPVPSVRETIVKRFLPSWNVIYLKTERETDNHDIVCLVLILG